MKKVTPKWILWAVIGVAVVVLVIVNRTRQHDETPRPEQSQVAGEYTMGNLLSPAEAAETARRFVVLWSMPEPGDTSETWEERLDPLVTDEIGRGLLVTDLANLPRLGLSQASPPDIQALSTSQATVVVTLEDGSRIAVEVIPYGSGYAVSSFSGLGEG